MGCRCEDKGSVPLSVIAESVAVNVMGAPSNMVEHYVRLAYIEFAAKSNLIKKDLYVDVQAGVEDYQLDMPDGYMVHMIEDVSYRNRNLRLSPNAPVDDCALYGKFFFAPPCTLLVGINAEEDECEALRVRVSTRPTITTCTIESWIADRYHEDLVAGALSKMLIVPGASWFNPQQGGIYMRRWKGHLASAKVEAVKAFSTAPMFMKPRRIV